MRTGKLAPTHNALTGHLSAALAHMANHSYRTGSVSSIDAIKSKIGHLPRFAETFDRMVTHLTDNQIPLGSITPTLGSSLTFDPVREIYTGENADAANQLDRDTYREGFTLPKT